MSKRLVLPEINSDVDKSEGLICLSWSLNCGVTHSCAESQWVFLFGYSCHNSKGRWSGLESVSVVFTGHIGTVLLKISHPSGILHCLQRSLKTGFFLS